VLQNKLHESLVSHCPTLRGVTRTDRVRIAQSECGWHEWEHEPQQVVGIAFRLGGLAVERESVNTGQCHHHINHLVLTVA